MIIHRAAGRSPVLKTKNDYHLFCFFFPRVSPSAILIKQTECNLSRVFLNDTENSKLFFLF